MNTIAKKSYYFNKPLANRVIDHLKWLRFAGFALVLIGLLTFIVPIVALRMPTFHPIAILAGLLGASGVVYFMHALTIKRDQRLGFMIYLLVGLSYFAVSNFIYLYPLANIALLAITLIVAYTIVGTFRIFTGLTQRTNSSAWGWLLVSGIVNISLAGFILSELPILSTSAFGFILGIEFLVSGWALLRLGYNANP